MKFKQKTPKIPLNFSLNSQIYQTPEFTRDLTIIFICFDALLQKTPKPFNDYTIKDAFKMCKK